VDLEHWPAFGNSFDALALLLGGLDPRVASVSVLSGDVHHSYVARPDLDGPPVYQLTCSPVHNRVPRLMRTVFRATWRPGSAWLGRLLSRLSRVEPTRVHWAKLAGPYFGNAVGSLVHSGRHAHVTIEAPASRVDLAKVVQVELADGEPTQPSVHYG
jgi:hypothetical protein